MRFAPSLYHLLQSIFIASVSVASSLPTVTLDNATVVGAPAENLALYLGIPFARPPIGPLRLNIPLPVAPYTGTINATVSGNQCIQKPEILPTLPANVPMAVEQFLQTITSVPNTPQSEDCLNLNVVAPANAKPGDNLPVAVWIYGGGNEFGQNLIAVPIANRSIVLGEPIIVVSANYRLNAFGFLGGQEIEQAGLGNLGLHDQREALRWVQKYISAFGGDPTKVTIFGESAGGEGVTDQLLANGGDPEGLFRAAWMDSGFTFPANSSIASQQPTFDLIVSDVGCSDFDDKLGCLRNVSTDALTIAMNKTASFLGFTSVNSPWAGARPDGVFLTDGPMQLVLEGKIANVPLILGATEDEGTLFSLASLNLTAEAEFRSYVSSNYFPRANSSTLDELLKIYAMNPAAGSPFGTGSIFSFTPEYKRISAFHGDLLVQAPRRFLAHQRVKAGQVVRSFISERSKVEGMGAPHTSELSNLLGGKDLSDFLVRFVNTLDPNDYSNASAVHWPEYTDCDAPEVLVLLDGDKPQEVRKDTFRKEATDFMTELTLTQPL